MRILTFKPKYGVVIPFMIEDTIDAFKELGHTVKCIPLDRYGDWSPKSKKIFCEEIEDFFPDFIFTIIYNEDMADLFTSKRIPLRPNLFGDKGWVHLLDGEKKVRFFGMIGYDRVCLVYKASKINLNINKITAKTGLNQRIFDVPVSDSFLLTDYRRDLSEFFNLDKEIVCYRDKEDLRDKANYFLNHPEERNRIVSNAKERILKEHTYKERMRYLIEVVCSEFS